MKSTAKDTGGSVQSFKCDPLARGDPPAPAVSGLSYQKAGGARALVDSSNQWPQHYPVGRRGHGAVHGQPRSYGHGTVQETDYSHRRSGSVLRQSRWVSRCL